MERKLGPSAQASLVEEWLRMDEHFDVANTRLGYTSKKQPKNPQIWFIIVISCHDSKC